MEEMKAFYEEELEDEMKYLMKADEIEKDDPKAAGILRDIAHEEHTHAKLIKHIMDR